MPSYALFPIDLVKPSEILSQYSEWIYFTLILVFFMVVAGITLKRHFDTPYIKPLIISVGLILTTGVFYFKEMLTSIFKGWGIMGAVLLVIVGGTIPYGLSRGFGLSAQKSFYLTYILFYILSWIQYPQIFFFLADHNLGLINLALLVFFVVAMFKLVKFSRSSTIDTKLDSRSPDESEIEREANWAGTEKHWIKTQAKKITKIKIRTIDDIWSLTEEVLQIVESHRNNLPRSEQQRISNILSGILKKEEVFQKGLENLKKIFKRIQFIDSDQFQKQKERLAESNGKKKKILTEQIVDEEEKQKIEKMILGFEQKLGKLIDDFNNNINQSVQTLRNSPYPLDATPYLVSAKAGLNKISGILKEMKNLEEKLIRLIKNEKKLLKKEKKTG